MSEFYDICVLGLGATGYATVAFCIEKDMRVAVSDDRIKPPLLSRLTADYPEVELSLGAFDTNMLLQSKRVVISPGISPDNPVIAFMQQHGISYCSDIDIFIEHCDVPIIAVTGSNGKSTVVKLIHDMLEASNHTSCMLGNIGKPVLSLLMQPEKQYDWIVMELSSFQLYWSHAIKVQLGVIVNIFPNHLNWHKTWSCYVQSKLKLLHAAERLVCSNGVKQYVDCPELQAKISWVVDEQSLMSSDMDNLKLVAALPETLRVHALIARQVADMVGIDRQTQTNTLTQFQPWPYRCQLESVKPGHWYNDAKSSNLAAARYALSNIHSKHGSKVVWIAGGLTKQEDFTQLGLWIGSYVEHAIVFGADKMLFLDNIKGFCPVSPVDHLHDALVLALQMTAADDVVVFSPAAASFDQFENYMHRGQCFTELLQALVSESSVDYNGC